MKIYSLSYRCHQTGRRLEWCGTRALAELAKKRLDEDGEYENVTLESVDIPTTKHGLAVWLNIHFDTDNG